VLQARNPERTDKLLQCLVTPEGIESECVLLFDFAIALAKRSADMNFIFRTHPVLPYEMLVQKYTRFAILPVNCMVSDLADIEEDFKRTDFLLYRGSSVSMYATMQGLRPVYYAVAGEISIDPLYQLGNWRITIQDENEFADAIRTHTALLPSEKNEMYLSARSYCEDYLQMPDENNFCNTILLKKQ
jgi:hypothetical protein